MPKTRRRDSATVEELVQAATPDEPTSALGPALMPDFSDALGLQDMMSRKGARAGGSDGGTAAPPPPTAPAPASPPVDYEKLIAKLFQTVDAAISAVAGIERESPEDLDINAQCVTPYVVRHAGTQESETAIRLLAIVGLVTFIATKLIRWSQKPKPPKPRPDVATAADDQLEHPDAVTA